MQMRAIIFFKKKSGRQVMVVIWHEERVSVASYCGIL